MNLTADSASFGGVGVGAGASLAVGWVTKVTEAFIAGPDTTRSDPFNPSQTRAGAKSRPKATRPSPPTPAHLTSPSGPRAATARSARRWAAWRRP